MLIRAAPPKWNEVDIVGLAALSPLMTSYVPWTAWSMRPGALVSLVNEIGIKRRRQVVELGSGTSTLFIARTLAPVGGRLLSIEHDDEWAAHLDEQLRHEGLQDVATIARVPLTAYTANREETSSAWTLPRVWYDVVTLRAVCPDGVDMLIVDGPPAGKQEEVLVREPAVRELCARLATTFTVALDDADRPAERETITRWEEQLDIEITLVERIALGIGRSDGGVLPFL
jgi:methyltransferase family protein